MWVNSFSDRNRSTMGMLAKDSGRSLSLRGRGSQARGQKPACLGCGLGRRSQARACGQRPVSLGCDCGKDWASGPWVGKQTAPCGITDVGGG